jgi:hypothetical protein
MNKIYFIISSLLLIFLVLSCSEKNEPVEVGTHPTEWNNPGSMQFHGKSVILSGPEECQSCHGESYQGGETGISCNDCHTDYPHPDGFGNSESPAYHGEHFKEIDNWNLTGCQFCHGSDYQGANSGVSCTQLECHYSDKGPEACNTCHGEFTSPVTNIQKWAPPKGLDEETNTTDAEVGAHQAHLTYYSYLPGTLPCRECHIVPENYSDEGHLDDSEGAEVIFNGILAVLSTQGGERVPMPVYNKSNNSCSEVYCHGNWGLLKSQSNFPNLYSNSLIEGNTALFSWVETTSPACGTCHNIPPKGHSNYGPGDCADCHGDVVNNNAKIIDSKKHANGKVNVFGREYDMF